MTTEVRIADLKARLSEHLRSVRRGGTLVVLDRDTAVARIVPYREAASGLVTRAPLAGLKPRDVTFPPPLRLRGDVLDYLDDERRDRG